MPAGNLIFVPLLVVSVPPVEASMVKLSYFGALAEKKDFTFSRSFEVGLITSLFFLQAISEVAMANDKMAVFENNCFIII